MKHVHSTTPEHALRSAIAIFLAAFMATIIAGMVTVAVLYFLFLPFQS